MKRGTPEWREKISQSLKGRKVWNTGTKGLVKANSGTFKKGNIPANKNKHYQLPHTWGKVISKEAIEKAKATKIKNRANHKYPKFENHWNWKGDSVGYRAVHRWLVNVYGRSDTCEQCGNKPGLTKVGKPKIHWANKSGEYLRDRSDWLQLCISCHWKYDGLVSNFHKGKPTPEKTPAKK